MPANTRTDEQRAADREQMRAMYLRGDTQAAIAAALGLSRPQVQYDLAQLQRAWRKSGIRSFDDQKAEQLAKIDELERTYWDAWEASRKDREIATQRQRANGDKEIMLRKEGQAGDPRFLDGVMSCIERRCKLLGLDAPTRQTITLTREQVDALDRETIASELVKRGWPA
jgi:hypothetical protein